MLGGSRSLRVVVGAVACSLAVVVVARRSGRRCLRRRASAPGAGSGVSPRAQRHNAQAPLFCGGGSLSRRGASRSAARTLCLCSLARSLPLWRRSPSGGAHVAIACGAALAFLAPALSCRRARGGVTLGRRSPSRRLAFSARCVVLGSSCSLRVVVGAVASSLGSVAVARRSRCHCLRRSRRRCLRRRTNAPGAGMLVHPRSRRRDARPRLFRGSGSFFQRSAKSSAACALCVWTLARSLPLTAVAVAQRSRRCCLRRTRRRCLRRRAGAPGAGFIVSPRSRWRDARPPLSVAAARFLGAVRSARRLLLSACGPWRGRFLSGVSRRRKTLTAPLPATLTVPLLAAPHQRSWRRLARAAALAATWRSAATLPWQRLVFSAQCEVLSGSRSRRVDLGAVAPSLAAVAVAQRSRRRCLRRTRRRCLRRRAGAPDAGFIVPPRSRRRGARPPLVVATARFLGAVRSARRLMLSARGRWRGRILSGGFRRRTTLAAPLPAALTVPRPAAPHWSSWRRLACAAAHARRRDARPPLYCDGGSLSRRGASCSAALTLCL